ncbi:uncharacterized protein LOC135820137 [Sycon ciliatum]|uniref:uncharacterized protein LOC135820137 n=1 Tax=Sycon ciliatum TaxID=27933 RepID=UPI0031F6ED52
MLGQQRDVEVGGTPVDMVDCYLSTEGGPFPTEQRINAKGNLGFSLVIVPVEGIDVLVSFIFTGLPYSFGELRYDVILVNDGEETLVSVTPRFRATNGDVFDLFLSGEPWLGFFDHTPLTLMTPSFNTITVQMLPAAGREPPPPPPPPPRQPIRPLMRRQEDARCVIQRRQVQRQAQRQDQRPQRRVRSAAYIARARRHAADRRARRSTNNPPPRPTPPPPPPPPTPPPPAPTRYNRFRDDVELVSECELSE